MHLKSKRQGLMLSPGVDAGRDPDEPVVLLTSRRAKATGLFLPDHFMVSKLCPLFLYTELSRTPAFNSVRSHQLLRPQ
jgi:hypothetical protein